MTNTAIILPTAIITFLEAILGLRREANLLDIPFAYQSHTYGALDKALLQGLVDALEVHTDLDFGTCTQVAHLLNQETVDNGEDLAYQIDLWNRDIISLAH